MEANIFPLFELKIDVSVTSPYYLGRTQLPVWGTGTGVKGSQVTSQEA